VVAGAFLVRDPVTSELFATRAGMFLVDSNDYLITYDRKRLQGRLNLQGGVIGDVQVSAQVPATTVPGAFLTTFSISRDGRINSRFSDGTEVGWDQIALYDFEQPEKLCPVGLGQFAGVAAAQPIPLQNVGVFGSTNSWVEAARWSW
jgi:flagellar hook protein FlgE